jgi:hypothetical protein
MLGALERNKLSHFDGILYVEVTCGINTLIVTSKAKYLFLKTLQHLQGGGEGA